MAAPTLKQETVECINEEESACSNNMYPSEPSETSEFVNYYDSKEYALKQLKKEFPEDECLQSHVSMNSKIVFEDMKLLKPIDEQTIRHENSEVPVSSIINEENDNKKYQVKVKTEGLEEQDILHNAEATSIHYDVLVTPRVVQCKLCSRIFKNSFNLLEHNNEHVKVKINIPGDNEMIELHQYQYYDKVFKNSDNMLALVGDVHGNEKPKDKLCRNQLPSTLHPDGIINDTNNDKLTGKAVEKMKYKCDSCEGTYKSKDILTVHIKSKHYDYGRTFECWCGKQFRTPQYLRGHMKRQHNGTNNDNKLTGKEVEKIKYKCDSCEGSFKSKNTLTVHIKSKHYDYGRTFDCWCGKQFRTPDYLRKHMRRQHDGNTNGTNNDKLTSKEVEKMKYKCDLCEGTYKSKFYLTLHIKRVHYDYGRTFDCLCGEQFRTPHYLREHMRQYHDGNINGTNNDKLTDKEVKKMKYKCNSCDGTYKSNYSLTLHIKRVHYDYGRMFACWCGKQFRTPILLTEHKRTLHVAKNKVYKCKYCEAEFNLKQCLTKHIKRMHYYYRKLFACWCGKHFRTPILLTEHKRTVHVAKNEVYKCKYCEAVFNGEQCLIKHIKRMHYDYGRRFECWCGKQFRTPQYLRVHIGRQHDGIINDTNNDKLTGKAVEKMKYKCDSCDGTYKSVYSLTVHIKRVHYDYGRTFACWCGKQFRSPDYLREHKRLRHDGKMKDRDNYEVRSQILLIE